MAVADAVLSFAVESIGKLLIEEANFLRGVSEEVRLLHEDLKSMEWFLKYADTKKNVRESVQPWVSEFRAIGYEANDMVEDYALRVSKEAGFTNTLKNCACVFSECHTRHDLGREIQSLRTRISNLTKRFSEYGIATILMEGQGSSSSMQQQLRRTYSFVIEDEAIGLETGADILLKCLLNEGEVDHHKVVSIYGMGGLGKTTLARKVYRNLKLKQYFTGFAWICISQQWQAKDILQGILVKLIPEERSEIMNCTEEEMAKRLQRVLQDRRCLVVLDDIWSRDAWDCIKHAFPLTEEGSKILLTTRNQDVALHIDSDGYHYQPPLSNEEESWELLRKKSLRGKGDQDAALSFAVESIGKLLIEEAKFLGGVRDEVRLLHDDLKSIEWFLKYADTKQKQSVRESVQPWVSEFRDFAYQANDVIEDYALRVGKEAGFMNSVKRRACVFSECYTRHDLGKEIQSLRTRISNLTKRFGEYGIATILTEGQGSISSVEQQLRRTNSFVVEDEDIGLGTGVDILVNCLVNEGEVGHHKVVSIYGMGGLGKTTLAKKVYHNPKLKQYFTGLAWICISQQWQAKDIFQRILVKLLPEQISEINNWPEEEMARRLQQILQDRRCFIVLDDVWEKAAWDCIKQAFPLTEEGSKILLTTRQKDVALHIDSAGYHYQPRILTKEESWELLQKKSLKGKCDQGGEDYQKLEVLGKTMVEYCGGLPLAIVVLGGILKTKNSPKEWSIVHDSIKSYLGKGESIGQGEGEVSKILAFSYYDLPYQLKPCFLYMGKFREDSEIETERLYQLWLAEGMVLANDRIGQESMMDVAERYLEELAKRCMVQVEINEEGQPAVTRFKSCRLHDLMRDLCLDKAEKENLYKVIDCRQENAIVHSAHSSAAIERQYGFVLRHSTEDFVKYIPSQKEQAKHLRSLLCECDSTTWCDGRKMMSLFNNFKMLRVLAINNLDMDSPPCFPYRPPLKCIGHLIHLRCLRFTGCYGIKLPSSFANLKYLETLDLSYCNGVTIPNVLWKMGHLRHLYFPRGLGRIYSPKLRLDGLISKQLEIVESLSNAHCHLKDLSKLTNLRALKATVVKNVEDLEQIINHISNCNYMRIASLRIRGCDFRIKSENNNNNNNKSLAVLEQVLFCKNLHKLEIRWGSCEKLPNHQGLHLLPAPGLTELTLMACKIEEDPMETLEKLPKLRKLVLGDHSFVGKEMICHAVGFPQLKRLQLVNLPKLEKWKVDEGAMPKLCHLEIFDCRRLEMIPDGLKSITTLNELDICGMPEEFGNRVQIVNGIEGRDYDKIRHVRSIAVRPYVFRPYLLHPVLLFL